MKEFENKTVLSTGAASGMGFLMCKRYVEEGGNAVLCDINPEALDRAVAEINAIREGSAIGVVCDVRDYEQVCNARDKAVEAFGSIDVLTHFAGGAETRVHGISGKIEFPDVPIEIYDWGLDVNLRGQIYFDHAVLKQMREQKSGLIVHIGSITGQEGSGHNISYSASKSAAMGGLTKAIAQYGAKYGIRSMCVSPGPVLTREAMANMRTMLARAAEPEEIIDFVIFLASDKGQFFNGTNVLIDGGRDAMERRKYGDK